MDDQTRSLVIGIGSPHGDDQVGWLAADQIAARNIPGVRVHKIASPIDLVELLHSAEQVHLLDAAVGLSAPVERLRCATESTYRKLKTLSGRGTHGIGVIHALKLANNVGHRTNHITLWLLAADGFEPLSAVSMTAKTSINQCVNDLAVKLL